MGFLTKAGGKGEPQEVEWRRTDLVAHGIEGA